VKYFLQAMGNDGIRSPVCLNPIPTALANPEKQVGAVAFRSGNRAMVLSGNGKKIQETLSFQGTPKEWKTCFPGQRSWKTCLPGERQLFPLTGPLVSPYETGTHHEKRQQPERTAG